MMNDILPNNRILNGTADLSVPRQDLLRDLQEAVDFQRQRAQNILVYRFGFLRLPFVSNRLDNGFNLHIWLDDLPRDPYPHTHIFDLESRVLQEKIVDHTWLVEDDKNGEYIRVQPQYQDGITTDQQLSGQVMVRAAGTRTLHKDETYSIAKGEYHSSEIPTFTNPTVTLLRKTNIDRSAHPINVIPLRKPKEQFFDLQSVSQESAWKILTEIVDKL